MKVCTNDGVELYVERSGKGVPCIFLHGGPGYWSKTFQHFAGEFLEESMEMIYLDQRGCGRSTHDQNRNYSLTRLIDDIEDVRIKLGIDKWYVMGHSFGGILAVNYAYTFPSRTEGVILSNATLNMFDSFGHQIKTGMEILNMEPIKMSADDLSVFIDNFYTVITRLADSGEYDSLQFENLENKRRMDILDKALGTDPAFQQFIFSQEEYFRDFTKLTDKIDKPTLIITGKQDDAIGPNHYQAFNFHNCNVCELEGRHHPYIENRRGFKKAIEEFVKKNKEVRH